MESAIRSKDYAATVARLRAIDEVPDCRCDYPCCEHRRLVQLLTDQFLGGPDAAAFQRWIDLLQLFDPAPDDDTYHERRQLPPPIVTVAKQRKAIRRKTRVRIMAERETLRLAISRPDDPWRKMPDLFAIRAIAERNGTYHEGDVVIQRTGYPEFVAEVCHERVESQ